MQDIRYCLNKMYRYSNYQFTLIFDYVISILPNRRWFEVCFKLCTLFT